MPPLLRPAPALGFAAALDLPGWLDLRAALGIYKKGYFRRERSCRLQAESATFQYGRRKDGRRSASRAYLRLALERSRFAFMTDSSRLLAKNSVRESGATILESPADQSPPPCAPTEFAKT